MRERYSRADQSLFKQASVSVRDCPRASLLAPPALELHHRQQGRCAQVRCKQPRRSSVRELSLRRCTNKGRGIRFMKCRRRVRTGTQLWTTPSTRGRPSVQGSRRFVHCTCAAIRAGQLFRFHPPSSCTLRQGSWCRRCRTSSRQEQQFWVVSFFHACGFNSRSTGNFRCRRPSVAGPFARSSSLHFGRRLSDKSRWRLCRVARKLIRRRRVRSKVRNRDNGRNDLVDV